MQGTYVFAFQKQTYFRLFYDQQGYPSCPLLFQRKSEYITEQLGRLRFRTEHQILTLCARSNCRTLERLEEPTCLIREFGNCAGGEELTPPQLHTSLPGINNNDNRLFE